MRKTARSAPMQRTLDTEKTAKIVGHAGEQNGPVHKVTIGRNDLDAKEI